MPSSRGDQAGLPVVFNLHAYDWTAVRTRDYLKTHLFGDSVGFITVYPSASDLTHWNSGISENPLTPTPDTDDVGFISLIIDSLISRFDIDTQRVYSCGYSNGGFMSLKLAGRLGNRITAIASVCGVISAGTAANYNSLKPIPALLIHGTDDPEVYYNGGQQGWYSVDQTIDLLRNQNLCQSLPETLYVPNIDLNDQSTVEKYTYSSSENTSQVILFKVIGGRHVWPDAAPIGSVPINRDINATREIWDFFKQFPSPNEAFITSAYNASIDRSIGHPGLDSISLSVVLVNSAKHSVALSAIIKDNAGVKRDSIPMFNDGLHYDGSSGDSIWGCKFLTPSDENMFTITVRTDDVNEGTYHLIPKAQFFSSAGPVVCIGDSVTTTPVWGSSKLIKFKIRNEGKSATVNGVMARLQSLDTSAVITSADVITIGN
ncbi:MAG: hypothetical protein Q7T74_01580, partial [Candidatus Saccharibacteria bacterium]|nr:hypothetical protein [Candidatus Saccharibacteria bacterium]